MNDNIDSITTKISLLGKEYPVSCSRTEEGDLILAARMLDDKMNSIRNAGRTIGVERIAVMAALNFAHELIKQRQEMDELAISSQQQLVKMMEKVETALEEI